MQGRLAAPGRGAPPQTSTVLQPAPEWGAALDAASAARLTVVIGESDTGKTSLVMRLAGGLLDRGLSVAVVDADLGQSEIGPPTTVGLGRVARPLGRLSDAELVALRFVGATSAARELVGAVVATRSIADRARRGGFDRLIVDTSGLVRGELGRRLKQAKIDVLGADLVVALQRQGECEPILHAYATARRPRILRFPAQNVAGRRTPDERRRHRERALAAHLAGARSIRLDLSRIVLRTPALLVGDPLPASDRRDAERAIDAELLWAERRAGELVVVTASALDERARRALGVRLRAGTVTDHAIQDLVGALAGLDDPSLDTLGLGVVEALDLGARIMTLTTAVAPDRVASVSVGRERYRPTSGVGVRAGSPAVD